MQNRPSTIADPADSPAWPASDATILLLTDKPTSDTRLARALGAIATTDVLDLLDPDQPPRSAGSRVPTIVVSDAGFASSVTIAALRRELSVFGTKRPTYICLLREDTPRSRTQAHALQATHVLDARDAIQRLPSLLSGLMPASDEIAENVAGASARLTRIFELGRSGGPIEPDLVQSSASFINDALHERSVSEWLERVWRIDDTTHQHCLLVAVLAAGFGRALGLRRSDCALLTQGALLHDVGKCKIPIEILRKPGRLSPEERAVIETHPAAGYAMLAGQGFAPELLAVVRSHHEFLDGSGYPDRLSGSAIPDLVRLTTICDIFAALTERRPYKEPNTNAQALAILQSMTGKLDMDLLRAFNPVALGAPDPKHADPAVASA